MRLDIRRASVERIADRARLQGATLPDFVLDILAQGGLMAKLAAEGYLPAAASSGS